MSLDNPQSTLTQKISHVLKDDGVAVELFMMWRDVLHFWDDLADQDKPVAPYDVDLSMFKALVAIPSNAFFRQHQDSLMPILVGAIANWQAANQFEQSNDVRKLQLAFVIRSDYANLLIHMAYLVGGYDWMAHVTPIIRDMWTSEDFSAYLVNLAGEMVMRRERTQGVTQ